MLIFVTVKALYKSEQLIISNENHLKLDLALVVKYY